MVVSLWKFMGDLPFFNKANLNSLMVELNLIFRKLEKKRFTLD